MADRRLEWARGGKGGAVGGGGGVKGRWRGRVGGSDRKRKGKGCKKRLVGWAVGWGH